MCKNSTQVSQKTPIKLLKQNYASPRSRQVKPVPRNILNSKKKQKTPNKVLKGKKIQTPKGGNVKKNEKCKKVADIRKFFEPKMPEASTANNENGGNYRKIESANHQLKSLVGNPEQYRGTDLQTATPSSPSKQETSSTDIQPSLDGGGINCSNAPATPPPRL